MRAKSSYTVRELADLTKESESTVRRLIEDGELALEEGPRPRRVTASSAHEYLRRLIDDGPQLPDGVARTRGIRPDRSSAGGRVEDTDDEVVNELKLTVRTLEAKVQDLDEENERFRNTIQGLRQAQGILLDNIGEFTSPKIPNN
jgi:excisionase family DNA binding protein